MPAPVKNKPPVTQLDAALRRAGFKHGESIEFRVSKKMVTIIPRQLDDDHKPAQRRAIDRGIAQSEKEYREGKNAGPFTTAEEFAASMEADIKKLRTARRKAKSAR